MMMLGRALAFAWLAFAWLALPAHALDSDSAQTATLQADAFSFDLTSGARMYRGNVSFRQGSIRLECDSLAAYEDAHGGVNKGVCSGRPGRLRQRPQGGDEELRGSARRIVFDARAAEIMLEGGAELVQSGKRIRGARIIYDIEQKSARVHGADADGGRARILIPPRKKAGG
ncbi:MAG: lipopolysaccharide transport periplasmic protein LptA [Gammaproteobacteria bacterium]